MLRLLTALTGLLVVLVPSPAHAQVWHAADPADDVTGTEFSLDPEPCGTASEAIDFSRPQIDLTGVEVRHDRHRVRVTLAVASARAHRQASFYVVVRTPGRTYDLDVRNLRLDGSWSLEAALLTHPEPPEDEDRDECGGYTTTSVGLPCTIDRSLDTAADTISVELPRRCLRRPDWISVSVSSLGWEQQGERRFTVITDALSDEEGAPRPSLNGPRIRASKGRVR